MTDLDEQIETAARELTLAEADLTAAHRRRDAAAARLIELRGRALERVIDRE